MRTIGRSPGAIEIARNNANFYASRDPFEDMSSFGSRTTPVGFYNGDTYDGYETLDSASPYGLYDMAGNVWQWTADVTEGLHDRYLRGGSKDTYEADLRIWVRNSATPTYFSPGVGFRCVRELLGRTLSFAATHGVRLTTRLRERLGAYWPLTKSLQTGLLLTTGLAGYMSARCPVMHWHDFLGLGLSLFLAIAGSTILNMWYDRDIDAVMNRTHHRPLASGRVRPREALRLGLLLSLLGVSLAALMAPLFGLIVFAGLLFDVVVYTLWLKRRTCWSILWGGLSGGMPILAGRAYGLGRVDEVGILLALAVLFWIPTHILTFSLRYAADYHAARIPTFPPPTEPGPPGR